MKKNHRSLLEYLGLPGIISVFGILFSWISIILLLQKEPFLAIISAIIAFYLDYLDGYVARKTKSESNFGKILDSLSDVINYLVFSALLFYLYISPNLLGIFVGFVILSAGLLRLSRFNSEGFIKENNVLYYSGLIVCFVSLVTILIFFFYQVNPQLALLISYPLIISVSLLQISRIKVKKTSTNGVWLFVAAILLILSMYFYLWQE